MTRMAADPITSLNGGPLVAPAGLHYERGSLQGVKYCENALVYHTAEDL